MQQQWWEQSEERKSQKRRSRTRDRQKRRSQRRERVRRRKTKVREKVEKPWNTVFFQWCVAPDGRKVGSLKRRVRSHLVGWEIKNCTPLWYEANFEVKMHKTAQAQSTFGRCRKSYEAVARSAFPSQNVKNILGSDRFWKLRYVEMFKQRTPLWREAHLEVKMLKTPQLRSTFARRCDAKHISKSKVLKLTVSDHFWTLRRWKSARDWGAKHISKWTW